MPEKRRRLLKAIEHNWGMMDPGDWSEVKWNIFYDGSYEVISTFNPTFEAYEEMLQRDDHPKPVKKKTTGRMDEETFSKLREAMKHEPWRDPTLDVDACDGVAWEIESYEDDGRVRSTSGKLDYIYGHRVLETIVSLLPADGNIYDSSAFVSVSKKNKNNFRPPV